jgi:acetyl esterase/lipase
MATADPSSVLTRRTEAPDAVLRWADAATHGHDGLVDVYLPEVAGSARQAPMVVALHGGFWRQKYDRRHLRPLAVALRSLGRAVVLPEYRRGRRGGWQDTIDDVRALRSRLPGLLAAVAPGVGAAVPPTVLGHSAGGHLALWWALDAEGAARPGRVLALAPVADLARAHADRLGDGAVAAWLGGGPDAVPEAYAVADVAARLRAGERPGCPVVVLQGSDDTDVPAAGMRPDGVRTEVLDGIEHYGLIDPYSRAWPDVVAGLG